MESLVDEAVKNHIYTQESKMKNQHLFGFHEATVQRFLRNNNEVTLDLDDVHVNGVIKSIRIICNGVKKLDTDGKNIDVQLMPTNDGEILTLEIFDRSLKVIIEWNEFDKHTSSTNAYEIECESITIVHGDNPA